MGRRALPGRSAPAHAPISIGSGGEGERWVSRGRCWGGWPWEGEKVECGARARPHITRAALGAKDSGACMPCANEGQRGAWHGKGCGPNVELQSKMVEGDQAWRRVVGASGLRGAHAPAAGIAGFEGCARSRAKGLQGAGAPESRGRARLNI
jgi:hypothetical protein